MNVHRVYITLTSIICLLFIILYFILSFNNRLPYEDYIITSMVKNYGTMDTVVHFYNFISGRWSSNMLAFSFSIFHENRFCLMGFNCITLFFLILSFYLLLKEIINRIFNFRVNKYLLFIYAILFTSCVFFSSYDIGEVWFWYIANWMYLWSVIAGNFLLWILLSGKLKAIYIPLIIILTAFISGASESYAMIYILIICSLLILKRKNKITPLTNAIKYNSLIIIFCLLILFYMIMVFAPATWARKDMLTDASFFEHLIMVGKAYGIVILKLTPKLIAYLILFGLPWMILGQSFSSEKKERMNKFVVPFVKITILTGILIFILILPASWVLYDLPPARALSQISLLLSIYSSFIFFFIGYKIEIPKKITQPIMIAALVTSMCILCFHIVNQYSITSNFSKEYDNRITYVNNENTTDRENAIIFEPLPPSGMIYCGELSTDSTSNKFFEKTYSLKFHVAVKKD